MKLPFPARLAVALPLAVLGCGTTPVPLDPGPLRPAMTDGVPGRAAGSGAPPALRSGGRRTSIPAWR
ncbi:MULTISPECIES: hypothetical protein [Sorangium]|uniref:hypothetical protein n=1 Tax=Sorangium TaxID=39643 RepID=UPI003D9C01C5